MQPLIIPKPPSSLYFNLDHFWDGTVCADERLQAEVWISQSTNGITIRCQAQILENQRTPVAPHDSRFDELWNYDVVEVFLVGKDGKYLEVELGAGGQWLVLGFDEVRHRANDYKTFDPVHRNSSSVPGCWQSIITIPQEMIPEGLHALNAFAIFDGNHLAVNPVPGTTPDFHQPNTFPEVTIE
jgi:hypothetical protein